MTKTDFFYYLQPLLVCHALPGLLGGVIRCLYLLRKAQYHRRPLWPMMVYDLFGGLLVGTLLGPLLSIGSVVPAPPFSMLEVLRSLPFWFAERWFISAGIGFFWLATMEALKEKITGLVRDVISKFGKKGDE